MKITFVSCAIEMDNLSFPLGLLSIKAALLKSGEFTDEEVSILLYDLSSDPVVAAKSLSKLPVDCFGLSIYLWNRAWFDSFVKTLRSLKKDVIIFAGGTEVSANYSSFSFDEYNYLIAGEGEDSDTALLIALKHNTIVDSVGVMSREKPEFSYASVADLSTLSSPFLTGITTPFIKEGCTVLWEMTRGCPFQCAFCFESKGLRGVRHYPFERVEQELDYLVAMDVKDVFVLDPTFNIDKDRTKKILTRIIETVPEDMHFTFELRAELLDEELASMFASFNCSLQIGLQSIHQSVLETVNRTFKKSVFTSKMKLLNKYQVTFGLDLIIGLPKDTLSLFKESLDYAVSCTPSNIDIFLLTMLPGTVVRQKAESYGMEYLEDAPYSTLSTPTFSKEDLAKALKLKDAADLLYTKGASCMWINKLCEALEATPCEVFELFSSFMDYLESKHRDCYKEDIFDLEDEFVAKAIRNLGKEEYAEVLTNYIELHQALVCLTDTGEEVEVMLNYNPNALSDLDHTSLDTFMATHSGHQAKQFTLFYDEDGNVNFD